MCAGRRPAPASPPTRGRISEIEIRHVGIRCVHDDLYARGGEALERPVRGGETITILNSVAGG